MRRVYYSLYGRLLDKELLLRSYKKVRRAGGAAGIDGQTLAQFGERLDDNLLQLLNELKTKQYRALPVKRVEIPKADGGVRLLGIPSVRDRVVQQAVNELLTPIFEEQFHPSSFGYRPNRSCHDAISKATMFIRRYGLKHVVDMDLSKCFDRLDHELIIQQVKKRVTDSSVLELMRQFLQSGVMIDGKLASTDIGSPQGGVISPLSANIYLDAFDQAMRDRGHRIVRYADDILILCRSAKGAQRALEVATKLLEQDLKLQVNGEKTHITQSRRGVNFLGVVIYSHYTKIQPKKLSLFKQKVKAMTKRNSGRPLASVIKQLNPLLRGFAQYFRIADTKSTFKELAQWVRRRLRSIQLKLWKKPKRLHRRLKQLGYKPPFESIAMWRRRNSASPLAHYAMPNKWLDSLTLYDMGKVETGYVFSAYAKW
ncbi:Group II intron-encoded protein ltrA [Oligella urethralis]|uniref:group II intron reverse transcriptase/maturase n=1 Tax=Oligella urethralis TaxID=90245 RepID=UPI000E08B508|nr:group II intron reverse transcriptase/maturase [Oligella urethralis]SUA64660.1 Group II intron-encoded protein ltrA [Oligella urethralis]SUA65720.1 Group II intron-encoded protein ltrA [Oligella urethralis]